MQKYKILIEYDGSNYSGWQNQKNAPSIQGTIEKALEVMTQQPITIYGSGRTDAGVHAFGQCAHYVCEANITADEFKKGLNGLLPRDIRITDCQKIHLNFHARYDALGKAYQYRILNRPTAAAIGRQYAWHIRKPLDIDTMARALSLIEGRHDFKAFEGSGSPRSSTIRTVSRATITQKPNQMLFINLHGDGFLKHMVRNIVGSIADTGLAKTTVDDFKTILKSKDRTKAGITAPARGLFLMHVDYP